MRRLRRGSRGLAEIVGTLLLVLIVVAAAAAFSIFVASYEAQVTAEEKAAHTRSLEDIRILSVSTVSNGATYASLSFVAGSLDVNTMTVNELTINGQYINYFTVTPLGTFSTSDVCALCGPGFATEFNLTTLEQVTITVNLTVYSASNPTGGFLNSYSIATSGPTNYIAIGVYTTLGNEFTRVFSAPTAVAETEQSEAYTGSGYQPVVVFDGSQSIVPANDTIVSWAWSINYGSSTCLGLTGEKVLVPQSEFPYGSYTAVLTIGDSNGLVGTTSISYSSSVTSPPVIMACPAEGPAQSSSVLVGAGFPSLGTVTVTFSTGSTGLVFSACSVGSPGGSDTITATTSGAFACTFQIPSGSTPGDQTLQATTSSPATSATTTFDVTVPYLSLTPIQGPSGATVAAAGTGFTPDAVITFTASAATVGSASFCEAGASGTFSECTFTVSSATMGLNTLTAAGSDDNLNDVATAPYTIT